LWNSDAQDIQRAQIGFGRLGQRLYSSGAVEGRAQPVQRDIIMREADAEKEDHTFSTTPKQSSDSGRASPFLGSLNGLRGAQYYDQAWEQLEMIDSTERQLCIPIFLAYISTSNRQIDADRATLLFEEIRGAAGPKEYGSVIKLHLNVENLQSAMELYYEGLTKSDVPVGSDILLAHALGKSHWQEACDIAVAFRRFRRERPSLSYDIWKPLAKLSNLYDRVIELVGFVRDELDKPSDLRINSDAFEFTADLISKSLLFMSGAKTLEPFQFNTLLNILQHWKADTNERYELFIERLLGSGRIKLAIQCYRKYRQRATKKISRPILDKVLQVVCKHHSTLGMQQVLDDWHRFYGSPSLAAYRLCISVFASQGDVNTVTTLFDQYIARWGYKRALKTADDIAPLLHVHAVRGELSEVLNIFNGIYEQYGLQPTIKCWNILLNAYGKVHDVDGAFDRFQELLNSPVRPDGYTYGTLMGICATRGDIEKALEIYKMAESQGLARDVVMVDCLVLLFIQDDRLFDAEQLCNDTLAMDLQVPLSRMWNYLLVAYAMRRDLENTDRVLRRMHEVGVDYDSATYAALMQALAMVNQPDRAYDILKNVMPEAGMKVTSFHYAVVMGGYIATGELHKVFQVHARMRKRNKEETISTRLMAFKANVMEDQRFFEASSQEDQLANAEQFFYDAYSAPDAREVVAPMRKGMNNVPLDVAYPSSYFGYLIFVLGQQKAYNRAIQLYDQYIENIPEHRRDELPLGILSAMMVANLRVKDYEKVQKLWELALERAKKQSQPVRISEPQESPKVLPLHKYALSSSLSTQILSLSRQQNFGKLMKTKKDVEEAGFVLDNKNWNLYIQCLVKAQRYRTAFELCEVVLMDGWTGWARLRWKGPERNRLPAKLRRLRKNKNLTLKRPVQSTFLYLGNAYVHIQARATESKRAEDLLNYIEGRCARTVHALRTMERMDDQMERAVREGL
jgi:pentatricopeptide repeat-containing protein PET309